MITTLGRSDNATAISAAQLAQNVTFDGETPT
jgi:hypothetical protein